MALPSVEEATQSFPTILIVATLLYVPYAVNLILLMWTTAKSGSPQEQSREPQQQQQPKSSSLMKKLVMSLALLMLYEVFVHFSSDHAGLDNLLRGTDPLLDELLDKTPSLKRGPSPPLFFRNAHLQFLPWLIQNEIHRLQEIPYQRMEFEVTACVDKSQTNCEPSSSMNDTITLDIFPPLQDVDSRFNEGFNKSSPIILFSPGLRCYSQDLPGNMIIRKAYGAGFRSIVVNRRGHTPGMLLKSPRWNLFGDIDDLEQVYWYVTGELAEPNTPIFLHGISSGTSVTVTAVGSWDKRRREQPDIPSPSFIASLAVTPGYDISKVLRPERFIFPYNDILTVAVKQHFVSQNEEILRAFDSRAVDETLAAASLQEFLDAAAPFAGYPNASEYYKGENPVNLMHDITTPKFVLNSVDDPCCNIGNLYEQSPYFQHDGRTYAEIVSRSLRGLVAVTKTGSHCPFLDGTFFPFVRDPLFGGWMLNSWADQVSIELYKAALEVYGDRRFM